MWLSKYLFQSLTYTMASTLVLLENLATLWHSSDERPLEAQTQQRKRIPWKRNTQTQHTLSENGEAFAKRTSFEMVEELRSLI